MELRIKRLSSMFLDHIAMCILLLPLFVIIAVLFAALFGSDSSTVMINERMLIITFIPFLIYLAKDSYRGKSPGKRLLGLQVVNNKTGDVAGSVRCFIRNLLIPLWPLEVCITLFSPNRRLGDLVAGTKVITSEKEPLHSIIPEVKQTKFNWNTLLILGISLVYGFLVNLIIFDGF